MKDDEGQSRAICKDVTSLSTTKDEPLITQVKNISQLKKLTPKVKLLTSPEVTKLRQFSTKINHEKSKVSTLPLKNYCRTCAGAKLPLVDIFSEKGMQMRLLQQMKHLEDINEHDSLSNQMCMDCICDLKMSYKFFMQIKKAHVKLKSISSSLVSTPDTTIVIDEESSPDIQSGKPEDSDEHDTRIRSENDADKDIEILQLSDDNESIEEFDPLDPPFQPECNSPAAESERENDQQKEPEKSSPEIKNSESNEDSSKMVYQYDTKLKAYVKVEPPAPKNNCKLPEPIVPITNAVKRKHEGDGATQPNILKKRPTAKNFLGKPVTSDNQSDPLLVIPGKKDARKPKLNVTNAINVKSGDKEDGIMYVTVKGTKPNEMLLVKVKKMEKSTSNSNVTKINKKDLDDSDAEKARAIDIREKIIDQQIEDYKRKRERILGGSASLPNVVKFEDGMIRFVNPIDNKEPPKDEPNTVTDSEIRRVVNDDESENLSDNESYANTVEYLSHLARLKKKWEEAKKKKESLQRELEESYTEGNLEKLGRILGEREKNLQDFQDYLKQRKIVITRLKDEDIISLYEDRNNAAKNNNNFPDLIDSTAPTDHAIMTNDDNYLECDYCPESFALRDVLEEHLKSHDFKLSYYCEDCNTEFVSAKAKRSHNVRCLSKLICKYCNTLLDSKGKKRQHEQKHIDNMYGQLCDVCGEKFKHQGTLDQHFKTQHMIWDKIYQCPKCPKKFAFKQKLSFHVKSVHTTMRAYLCEDCGADFKNPASLRHHRIRKHHPTSNKRECSVCGKMVPFYSLSKHMYTHKAYTIQCPHCDKMFKNSSTLKQHLRIHEDQRQYRCDTCGVGFNRRDGLRLHMRVHQKSDSRSLKECSCQICSEKFPNHSMLVIHRNRVHKDGRQYTCHICNRSMLSTRSLEWHMSHIHNEVITGGSADPAEDETSAVSSEKKRVSCQHCDKTFKTEMILRTHIKNTHMEKDPTKCLDCDLTFTSDVRLRHHMMVAHNRLEGTLPCPHCTKRFVNQLRLKTHLISHSEDRPYTCEICGFNLKTKIQLIKHHQNRHSDERPLQCRYCPWRCKQVSALVCHERTHTNERPYSCIVCRQRFKYLGDKNKHERRHESLGGSGFKRIVAGRNIKKQQQQPVNARRLQIASSTSELEDPLEYENPQDEDDEEEEDEERLVEEEHSYGDKREFEEEEEEEYDDDVKFDRKGSIGKFENVDVEQGYEEIYQQVSYEIFLSFFFSHWGFAYRV